MNKLPKTLKIVNEAIEKLKAFSGLSIKINKSVPDDDVFINIGDIKFRVSIKASVTSGNKLSIYSNSFNSESRKQYPTLIVSEYIPSEIKNEFIKAGINFLDIAGNAYIRQGKLFIFIDGKKRDRIPKTNQARAFQESGIKIIFHLLNDPLNLQLTYRKLADLADVSLGSVAGVLKELNDLGFILETGDQRILKNKTLLLDRWVTAYLDVLRPRLVLKRMKFTSPEQYRNWNKLPFQKADSALLWGGEPAASLLTNYLSPEIFSIYTNYSWQDLMLNLKLVPSDSGDIEVLNVFWKENDKSRNKGTVPPLLVYADLIGSTSGRNIETAKMILENELSNIFNTV